MTAVIAHRQHEQFLVDLGDGSGRVYDARKDLLYEPYAVKEIIDRGFWQPMAAGLVEAGVLSKIENHLGTTDFKALAEADIETDASDGPGEFTLTLLDESKPTIDGRDFEPDKVDWREPPLPLLFITRNTHEGHKDAEVAGSIREIWRDGPLIKGKGIFDSGENGQELRRLIKEGTMIGVSSDVGGAIQEEQLSEDGHPHKRILQGRIMGATVLPFQAFDDTRIAVTAAATVPDTPPREWFTNPELAAPTPLTVTADGRIFGHAALWGTCHIGRPNTCLTPPKSRSGYAMFTTGTVFCADGSQVATGPITLGTGHAKLSLSAKPAAEHYDHTGTAVADVSAGEDQHGIWVAGALRPNLEPERVRELRAAALSGDWRAIGGALELVALLAVNTPGFPIPRSTQRFAAEQPVALVAAGVYDQEPSMDTAITDAVVEAAAEASEPEQPEAVAAAGCVECGDDTPDVVEEYTEEELAAYHARLDALEESIASLAASALDRLDFSVPPMFRLESQPEPENAADVEPVEA